MQESLILKGLRTQMVERLRKQGIVDLNVLNAMGKVPRHLFIQKGFEEHAYEDKPFSIEAGQTISQPYTVALQSELLQIQKFDKVLEIGTGSGYQAVILAEMGANLYTIERQKELFIKSRKMFNLLRYSIKSYWGDGYEGSPSYAPFKRIIITAAIPEIPQKLLDQLSIGGRLVAPVGEEKEQTMTMVDKIANNEYKISKCDTPFKFVPMLKGSV